MLGTWLMHLGRGCYLLTKWGCGSPLPLPSCLHPLPTTPSRQPLLWLAVLFGDSSTVKPRGRTYRSLIAALEKAGLGDVVGVWRRSRVSMQLAAFSAFCARHLATSAAAATAPPPIKIGEGWWTGAGALPSAHCLPPAFPHMPLSFPPTLRRGAPGPDSAGAIRWGELNLIVHLRVSMHLVWSGRAALKEVLWGGHVGKHATSCKEGERASRKAPSAEPCPPIWPPSVTPSQSHLLPTHALTSGLPGPPGDVEPCGAGPRL